MSSTLARKFHTIAGRDRLFGPEGGRPLQRRAQTSCLLLICGENPHIGKAISLIVLIERIGSKNCSMRSLTGGNCPASQGKREPLLWTGFRNALQFKYQAPNRDRKAPGRDASRPRAKAPSWNDLGKSWGRKTTCFVRRTLRTGSGFESRFFAFRVPKLSRTSVAVEPFCKAW